MTNQRTSTHIDRPASARDRAGFRIRGDAATKNQARIRLQGRRDFVDLDGKKVTLIRRIADWWERRA